LKGERKLAKMELKPGIVLDEKDFHGYDGVTRYSLEFWEKVKKRLGTVDQIEQTFSEADWFKTSITDSNGVTIIMRGFASGYHGEGPRGLAQLLDEIGVDGNVAYERKKFKIVRD
jgi:hypothetical protein